MSSHLQHLRNFGRRVAQISVVATGGLGIDQEWDEWDGPLLAVVLLLLAAPLLRILWLGQINSVCFRLFIFVRGRLAFFQCTFCWMLPRLGICDSRFCVNQGTSLHSPLLQQGGKRKCAP